MDELWGHCPKCDRWFLVEDPSVDALYLCPNDLMRADDFRARVFERRREN